MAKARLMIVLAAILLVLPSAVLAYDIKSGTSVIVGKEQPVDGNLYAFGQTIVIDADVNGDVICAGQAVTINGEVEGSVLCAGQSITINGKVGGSAGLAGESVTTNNAVARNLTAFASRLNFEEKSSTGWDLCVGSAEAVIKGSVGRDLYGGSGKASIFGKIGRNVELDMSKAVGASALSVENGAEIAGRLDYTSETEASIQDGSVIGGEIARKNPGQKRDALVYAWARWKVYSIFAALIIGLVLVSLWRRTMEKMTDLMLARAGSAMGWGFLVLFFTPALAIMLAITFIGLPLAAALICLWAVLIMASKAITGILIGRSLVEKFWPARKGSMTWAMIIGVIASYIVFSIPLIGGLAILASTVWGVGAAFLYLKQHALG